MHVCTPASQASHYVTELRTELAASPVWFFDTHAYCRELDHGAIILDLRNDTYLGVETRHLSYLRASIGNWPDSDRSDRNATTRDVSASEGLIADLLSRGILTTSPTSRQPTPAAIPTMALTVASFGVTRKAIRLAHAAQFSIALLMVVWCLKRSDLSSLLAWLRRSQSSMHGGHSIAHEDISERLGSFLWLRAWCYTAKRRCLFDSLVLSIYLTRGMIPCTFVIGVATKPFLAHAWVQIGETVLNDTAEHVQDFQPILSTGGE